MAPVDKGLPEVAETPPTENLGDCFSCGEEKTSCAYGGSRGLKLTLLSCFPWKDTEKRFSSEAASRPTTLFSSCRWSLYPEGVLHRPL
uniref:Uncharacterized protein n=1 Tax=Rhizophora mucronata TaxID=61149 RepID=A0A2P2P2D5_RHIMU